MKRVFGLFVVLMALGLRPAPAAAATITNLQFCDAAGNMGGVESSSCPAGLSAFLKIDTSAIGTNEYDVTLTLDSTLIDTSTFASIPQVQFTIGGVVGSTTPGLATINRSQRLMSADCREPTPARGTLNSQTSTTV